MSNDVTTAAFIVTRVPSTTDRRAVFVSLTKEGRSLAYRVATQFEADVTMLLAPLARVDRDALSELLSRVLVAHAAARGVDLFATVDTEGDA